MNTVGQTKEFDGSFQTKYSEGPYGSVYFNLNYATEGDEIAFLSV
jgi:hypothetical protein